MITATIYNLSNGAVAKIMSLMDGDLANQVGAQQGCISGYWDGSLYYILNGVPTLRTNVTISVDKASIKSDGVDAATLSGLPNPCWIEINGVDHQVTGGAYTFTSSSPCHSLISLVGAYSSQLVEIISYDLAALKSDVSDRIDAAAEASRLKYITGGSGQALVYRAKEDEARAYQAATSPVNTDYPILNSEATATGVTVAALASSVITLATQWTSLAAQIEGLRMGGKKAVTNATTIAGVLSAENITWP